MTDEFGATRPATLTITITGTNDGPVAVGDTNAGDAVTEPASIRQHGVPAMRARRATCSPTTPMWTPASGR